jgi:hypothetical protein
MYGFAGGSGSRAVAVAGIPTSDINHQSSILNPQSLDINKIFDTVHEPRTFKKPKNTISLPYPTY